MTTGQRVADAIGEWWVHPIATALPLDRTVFGAISSTGEILACEMDHTTGVSRRIVVGSAVTDDHNCPALWAMDGHRSVIIWSQHGGDSLLRVKVSNPTGDIESLATATEVTFHAPSGVSYAQVHRINHLSSGTQDTFWVFTRIGLTTWQMVPMTVDQPTGVITFGDMQQIISSVDQCYISTADAFATGSQVIRFAWGYNPALAPSSVRYVEINCVTGAISSIVDPGVSANIVSGAGLPLVDSTVVPLLDPVATGRSRRLFYARPGPASPAVAYAEWDESAPDDATYYVAQRVGSSWVTTSYGSAGPRLGFSAASNYIAGMSFPSPCPDDRVAVSREAGGLSSVELIVTTAGDLSAVVLASSDGTRLARPVFPSGRIDRVLASDVSYYGESFTQYAADILALFSDPHADVVTAGTAQVTIICGELRTGRILATVPVSVATWEQTHRDDGSVDITIPLFSAEVQAMPELLSYLDGPKFYLAAQCGDQILEAGPIWAWSYDGKSSLQVKAGGMGSIFDHRKVMKVLAPGENPAETTLTWSGLSLATLAKRLISTAMSHAGGSLPIVLPADILGDNERDWPGYELATVADEVKAIMGVIGGPDISFEPRLTSDNLRVEWVMRTGTKADPMLHQAATTGSGTRPWPVATSRASA